MLDLYYLFILSHVILLVKLCSLISQLGSQTLFVWLLQLNVEQTASHTENVKKKKKEKKIIYKSIRKNSEVKITLGLLFDNKDSNVHLGPKQQESKQF